jgi:HTH DNA binding domain
MPRAKLNVTLPDGLWIARLSREHPEVRFLVLAALPADGTGIGLVELRGPDLQAVVGTMAEAAAVTSLESLRSADEKEIVRFETDEPLLLFAIQRSAIPLEPPVEIRDGVASLEVTAPRERLSTLGIQLEGFGMSFDVEYITQSIDTDDLLTDRQRRLVSAAIERGYYNTPRECSLSELAEAVGIAKSTASETLHRAEGAIIKHHMSTPSLD